MFKDRQDAGKALAEEIANSLDLEPSNVTIFGIPRGGVVLADIVATKLSCDFDIVIPRKLGAPHNEELAIGAVMQDGTSYINQYLVKALRISSEYIESEKNRQADEIKRRFGLYRNPNLPYKIKDRITILVDDGIATGATIVASAGWLRKHGPRSVVVAAPVAPVQSVSLLESEADSIVILNTPRDFGSVGEFYSDFEAVTDDEVVEIMKKRSLL